VVGKRSMEKVKKEEIKSILIKLTDSIGYNNSDEHLTAFEEANEKLNILMDNLLEEKESNIQ